MIRWRFLLLGLIISIAAGVAAVLYVPLVLWKPIFPGLLVALSMLGAAALVRLARNAPITTPTAFDEDDLRRFFDTLEELNRRLFWIFIQVLLSIVVVFFAVFLSEHRGGVFGYGLIGSAICSGLLASVTVWLFFRVIAMAKGDIGFVRLQREILENSLKRQRVTAAERAASSPIEFRSPGGYGRAV